MKRLKWVSLASFAAVAGAEIFCRAALGLGRPPLSQADPQIEYLFRPSQSIRRFGHIIHINDYSMRSDDFSAHKTDPAELRVMVIGDSVVYDGVQVDQKNISTEVMKRLLERDLKRKVVAGNIAARGWGPPNELAFVKKFGLFDADAVVLVMNSHDYADVPTFVPTIDVDPDYPGHNPMFALAELSTRYVPRYLPAGWARRQQPENPNPSRKDIEWALSAVRDLIDVSRHSGAKVFLAQMSERDEIDGHLKPGHDMIREIAKRMQVPVLDVGKRFEEAVHEGRNPYLDNIHPDDLGCKIMGETIARGIETSEFADVRAASEGSLPRAGK
jgi:hypothetical protein